jgi:hypothetical protein
MFQTLLLLSGIRLISSFSNPSRRIWACYLVYYMRVVDRLYAHLEVLEVFTKCAGLNED